MSDTRQQDLFHDLPRNERKRLLQALTLPNGKHGSDTAAGGTLCKVLESIESFASDDQGSRCWASRERIAKRARCSTRTVSRATAILERCGLLLRLNEPKRRSPTKVYRIDYNMVKRFTEHPATPETMGHDGNVNVATMAHNPGHDGNVNVATMAHNPCHGVPQIERESNKKPPPTKSESVVVDCDVSWKDAETAIAAAGVAMVGDTLQAAQQSELTPREVVRIASEGKTRCDGPGGIRHRITKGGWPDGRPDRQNVTTAANLPPEKRERLARERAERIRNDARCDVKRKHGLPIREPDASRAVFDALKAAGLERFATESERAAGASTSHYGKQAS